MAIDMCTGMIKREVNLDGTGFKPVALLLDNKSDIILCGMVIIIILFFVFIIS